MKYLLIAVLLLPACGKDEDVKTHYNFESEQRKIELDFNRRQAEYQADYATHINRAISKEEMDLGLKDLQVSMCINPLTIVCQNSPINRKNCYASTYNGTSVHYNCFPTYDSYEG